MTGPSASRAFIDTNVFLSATDPTRTLHRQALFALEDWPSQGVHTYTSTQVLREYLVVATRPAAANGLGLSLTDALANVEQFEQVVELLPETLKTWDGLRSVLSRSPVTGVRLHDANIAACALAHGVDAILTANPADFTGLPVTILTLSSLAS